MSETPTQPKSDDSPRVRPSRSQGPLETLVVKVYPPHERGAKGTVAVEYRGLGRLFNTILHSCPLAMVANSAFPAKDFDLTLDYEGRLPALVDCDDDPEAEQVEAPL